MKILIICGMDLAKDVCEMLAGTDRNGFSSLFQLMYVVEYVRKPIRKMGRIFSAVCSDRTRRDDFKLMGKVDSN